MTDRLSRDELIERMARAAWDSREQFLPERARQSWDERMKSNDPRVAVDYMLAQAAAALSVVEKHGLPGE